MPEIHFATAKNSELIFTSDGRHLCSSVRPTKEAQNWFNHHQGLYQNCRSVFVLGLGCGYHVRALRMSGEFNVIVLENSHDIVQAALKVHPLDLRESDIVVWNDIADIVNVKSVQAATQNSYAVLIHEPSAFSNPALYSTTKEFLLGRTKNGLQWLFQNRDWEVPELGEPTEINLTCLDGILEMQRSGARPVQPAMQALRELIA